MWSRLLTHIIMQATFSANAATDTVGQTSDVHESLALVPNQIPSASCSEMSEVWMRLRDCVADARQQQPRRDGTAPAGLSHVGLSIRQELTMRPLVTQSGSGSVAVLGCGGLLSGMMRAGTS